MAAPITHGNFFDANTTIARAQEVRLKIKSDEGQPTSTIVGLLQNVQITIDGGIRPFFELGSEIKFFIPDRPRVSLRADKLFCRDSTVTNNVGPNIIGKDAPGAGVPGVLLAKILTEKGFLVEFTGFVSNLPVDMVFLLESYSFVANVGNLVCMENISAAGECNSIADNYELAASSITG